MAERNLCLVADRVLCLLRSKEVRESGIVKSDECERMEESISRIAPLLLNAEMKSLEFDFPTRMVADLGEGLHCLEDFLEGVKMFEEQKQEEANKKKKKKKLSRLFLQSSSSSPSFSTTLYKRGQDFLRDYEADGIEYRVKRWNFSEVPEKPIQPEDEVIAEGSCSLDDGWGLIREKDKEAIMGMLLDKKDEELELLSLVGEEETGRDILERYVIPDKRIQTHFHFHAWLDYRLPDEAEQKLRELSRGKRSLIVIDRKFIEHLHQRGVELIEHLQQNSAPGSKLLVLTKFTIRRVGGRLCRYYHFECLNEEESWDLFKKILFKQGIKPFPGSELEHIQGTIAYRCKACPYALMVFGGILSSQFYSEEDRLIFCNKKLLPYIDKPRESYLYRDPILKLSYCYLQSPLKHCLAYCNLFPSYSEINVQSLVKLWMANGFIMPLTETSSIKSADDLEDIGYMYFLNLLRRSFFHQAGFDATGRLIKCQMHYLVHELAGWVSGDQRVMFSMVRNFNESRNTLHVSFTHSSEEQGDVLFRMDKRRYYLLRSLLFPAQRERENHLISDWDEIFTRCRMLRVLDMHAHGIKTIPNSIGELKHLRYLDLSGNKDIMKLPDSITKLFNLQTLKLSHCVKLKELPKDIGRLVNLRHLENEGCLSLTSLPRGFGHMTNLRTLSQFVHRRDASKANEELEELKQLSLLRELQVINLGHGMSEKIGSCLKQMKRVRFLSIEWESREPEFDNVMVQLSGNLSSSVEELILKGARAITGSSFVPSTADNLVKLTLKRVLKCRILPPIDHCLKLKVLVIDEMPDLEYITSATTFSTQVCPSLEQLWLTELLQLKSWCKEIDDTRVVSFPCLSRLVIEDCPNLGSMPLFPTLEEGLVLDSTSWELFEKTMKLTPSSSSSNSLPLSNLKNLCIVGIKNFDNSKANEIAWDTLKSLRLLKFDFLPATTTLPEGLQHVRSLQELHIWRSGTKEIPEWIDKLELLERLVIRSCPDLKLLPESISNLQNLMTLEIEDCYTLLRRCEKEVGADWTKIAHIPIKRFGRISAK